MHKNILFVLEKSGSKIKKPVLRGPYGHYQITNIFLYNITKVAIRVQENLVLWQPF